MSSLIVFPFKSEDITVFRKNIYEAAIPNSLREFVAPLLMTFMNRQDIPVP